MYRPASGSSPLSPSSANGAPAYACLDGIRGRSAPLLASSPALIVIDPQRLFLDRSSPACLPDAESVVSNIAQLVEIFRQRNLSIVFTRHAEPADGQRGTFADFFPRALTAADPLSAIVPSIANLIRPGELITKSRHEAIGAEMPAGLKDSDAIFMAGVQTHLCVMASAICLGARGILPVIVADACGARDVETHFSALLCLGSGHAHIRYLREIAETLDSCRGDSRG